MTVNHSCGSNPAGNRGGSSSYKLRRFWSGGVPAVDYNFVMSTLFTNNNENNCHISTGVAYKLVYYNNHGATWSHVWVSIPDYTQRLSAAKVFFNQPLYTGGADIVWSVFYNTYHNTNFYHQITV
jgi:hypothetical protein